jgi:hypothetical protein
MKKFLLCVSVASLIIGAAFVAGCSSDGGPVTKDDVNKMNAGLPADNGNGPGIKGGGASPSLAGRTGGVGAKPK